MIAGPPMPLPLVRKASELLGERDEIVAVLGDPLAVAIHDRKAGCVARPQLAGGALGDAQAAVAVQGLADARLDRAKLGLDGEGVAHVTGPPSPCCVSMRWKLGPIKGM